MAESVQFTLEQGAEFKRTLTYKNSSGNPIDISGHSVRMDIREEKDKSSDILYDVDSNGDINITDSTGGEITIQIPDTQTKDFSWKGNGFFDVELDPGSDDTIRLVQGRISVDTEVTD